MITVYDLSAALQQGLSEPFVSLSNISGVCPTSYCTWEPCKTLAMCVDTKEISLLDILLTGNDYRVILKDGIDSPPVSLLSTPGGASRSFWMTGASRLTTINETKQFVNDRGQNETLCTLNDLR